MRFFGQATVFRLGPCTVFRVANELGHFRLGITLKGRSRAVDRNRVRRVIREAFRELGAVLGAFDYNVVIPATRDLRHPFPGRLRDALRSPWWKGPGEKPVR